LFFGGVDGSVWELIYRRLASLRYRSVGFSPMNRLPQVPIRR
jgi:hypothetical protein